jgi:hypothetical protein
MNKTLQDYIKATTQLIDITAKFNSYGGGLSYLGAYIAASANHAILEAKLRCGK